MFLLVIDFNYLKGRDGEMVVKELAAVDSTCNRVSAYVLRDCTYVMNRLC
jgi:hypothetical protein